MADVVIGAVASVAAVATAEGYRPEDHDASSIGISVRTSGAQRDAAEDAKRVRMSKFCREFVDSDRFQCFMLAAVVANAVFVGVNVQWTAEHVGTGDEEQPIWMYICMHTFTVIFAIELFVRIKGYGLHDLFIQQGLSLVWLDALVVAYVIFEMVVDLIYLAGMGDNKSIARVGQLRLARIVKVGRLVRAFRIHRIITFVAPLRTMVHSITVSLKSLMWAMVLLFLIIYMVGVFIVQIVAGFLEDDGLHPTVVSGLQDYWASLDTAMFTLFQSITGGVSWRDPAKPLGQVSPMMTCLFTSFVGFVYFAVLNGITGIFCNSTILTGLRSPEAIATAMLNNKKTYKTNLRTMFNNAGTDGSGMITLSELETCLADERRHARLLSSGIDANDAWSLFRLIDVDRSGAVERDALIEGCGSLRGNAMGIDVGTLRTELRSLSVQSARFMENCEEQLETLTGTKFSHRATS